MGPQCIWCAPWTENIVNPHLGCSLDIWCCCAGWSFSWTKDSISPEFEAKHLRLAVMTRASKSCRCRKNWAVCGAVIVSKDWLLQYYIVYCLFHELNFLTCFNVIIQVHCDTVKICMTHCFTRLWLLIFLKNLYDLFSKQFFSQAYISNFYLLNF